jgi:hypothetical protein
MSTEMLRLVDDLVAEITAARGVAAAINGLVDLPEDGNTREGVVNFQLEHIDRLVNIKERLEALRTATVKTGEAHP